MEFHSCVTVESLLFSLSIEVYNLWSKNAVVLDAFMAVSIDSAVKASQKTVFFDHNMVISGQ
jgi:hypothetical protein